MQPGGRSTKNTKIDIKTGPEETAGSFAWMNKGREVLKDRLTKKRKNADLALSL